MQVSSSETVAGGGSEAGPDMVAYRSALERTLGAPAAAHPVEAYGDGKLSLAGARRRIGATIKWVAPAGLVGRSAEHAAGTFYGDLLTCIYCQHSAQ
jgi:hypothetical protein